MSLDFVKLNSAQEDLVLPSNVSDITIIVLREHLVGKGQNYGNGSTRKKSSLLSLPPPF